MSVKNGVVKKLVLICSISMLTAITLVGCGGDKAKTIDVNALASSLKSEITYQDDISEIDFDTASQIYDFEDVTVKNSAFYEGSGATAEEIVVIECEKSSDVDKVEKILNERVEEQKQSFQDYVPAELDKLKNPVIITKGNYAILSVSNEPDKAKEIIAAAFK